MWQLLRSPDVADGQTREFIQEISATVTRSSVLILGAIFVLWAYVLGAAQPAPYLANIMLLGFPAVITLVLTLRLVDNHLRLAQAAALAGFGLSVVLALYLFGRGSVGLLLALLPLLGAMFAGWRGALLSETGVILLALILSRYPAAFPVSQSEWLIVVIGGCLTGLLGSINVGALTAVVNRAYRDSRTARQQIEEARRQRQELFQVQEDLLQANRELARLSERLKAMTQVAEEARRVKEEFVANVSHELRTPLNMIIGFSELIAKSPRIYGDLPPALLADIAAIQRNSQHLAELVNDVLDLSQVDAGRMALIKEWTTVNELVDAAIGATKVLFDTKGLYLKTELPDRPVEIFCDQTRIREVLLNLLSNAGRFTDHGGVTISAKVQGGQIIISVADTGPGIAPENLSRLFEPFQQIDNSIRRPGGSGLGLSISKRFVELHEGKMWLESQLGVGTTFHFSLPLYEPVSRPAEVSGSRRWITPYHQPEIAARRSKAPAPVVLPRLVLLDRGTALKRLFERYQDSLEIAPVEDLESAIDELSRSPCQGFVVNAATTGITAESLQQAGRIPFITPVMTCWIAGTDQMAKKLGVTDYLLKPVSREKLLGAINNAGQNVRTVLLVDDEIEVLQLFARILNSADEPYKVLRARDGRQALEILRTRRPDVMLIDLIMPEMDGFQTLKEKEQDPTIRDIPTIVISSKDPQGAPIVSESLTVARKGGLSTRELLACIQAVTEILSPEMPAAGRARRESVPG